MRSEERWNDAQANGAWNGTQGVKAGQQRCGAKLFRHAMGWCGAILTGLKYVKMRWFCILLFFCSIFSFMGSKQKKITLSWRVVFRGLYACFGVNVCMCEILCEQNMFLACRQVLHIPHHTHIGIPRSSTYLMNIPNEPYSQDKASGPGERVKKKKCEWVTERERGGKGFEEFNLVRNKFYIKLLVQMLCVSLVEKERHRLKIYLNIKIWGKDIYVYGRSSI